MAEIPQPPPALPGFASFEAAMDQALAEARSAQSRGEVPVGALLVSDKGVVLAAAHNAPIGASDPTAHAEILAIRRACAAAGNYRLVGAVLVVTLEPCLMCLGAIVQARLAGVVFGAADPKSGALSSCLDGPALPFLNHRFWTVGGVKAEACGALLSDFFRNRRSAAGEEPPCPLDAGRIDRY